MRILLVVLAAVMLAGCADQTNIHRYASYRYTCCPELTTTWHPGQHVSLKWVAESGGSVADPSPHPIELRASLTGPFATVDVLKQDVSEGKVPAGVTTTTGSSALVDNQTQMVATNEFDLPANLAPGYYNLKTESVSTNLVQSGGAVILVAP